MPTIEFSHIEVVCSDCVEPVAHDLTLRLSSGEEDPLDLSIMASGEAITRGGSHHDGLRGMDGKEHHNMLFKTCSGIPLGEAYTPSKATVEVGFKVSQPGIKKVFDRRTGKQ